MYEKPKSWCYCGHLGDGPGSQHDGFNGHGACLVADCECIQFTWKEFTDECKSYFERDTSIVLTQAEGDTLYAALCRSDHPQVNDAMSLLRVAGYDPYWREKR